MHNNNFTEREIPSDSEPGKAFELFKTQYTYSRKKGESLSKHPKGKVSITGHVPDKHFPSEGGVFKMHYHRAAGLLCFGNIRLEECTNVIVEDGLVYFEDKSQLGKYILVPCYLN
jgi:hypothetical protein